MKASDITFRKIHEAEANHHAEVACKNRGISPDSEKYEDEYKKHFIKYLEDVKTAMTVDHSEAFDEIVKGVNANIFGENPTSPKIADYLWKEFPSFKKDGFFDRLHNTMTNEEIEQKKAQFKGAILSLANLFLDVSAKKKTKGQKLSDLTKRSELSDFQYRKWPKGEAPDSQKEEDMVQVEINRYNRIYVVCYVMFLLDRMMEQEGKKGRGSFDIAKELMQKSDLFPKDANGKITHKSLMGEKPRLQFIKACQKNIEEEYKEGFANYVKKQVEKMKEENF